MEVPAGSITTVSKAEITLMSSKSKVLQLDMQKQWNCSILDYCCLFILLVVYLMVLLVSQTVQGEKKAKLLHIVILCTKICSKYWTTNIVWCLIFKVHVLATHNIQQFCYYQCCFYTATHKAYHVAVTVLLNVNVQCTARWSCDQRVMEYTHYEYCDMLLTVGACDSQAGTASCEHAEHYPGWCYPDATVFRW
jgi:hypothetical protein